MDHMDPYVHCPKKPVKLKLSLTRKIFAYHLMGIHRRIPLTNGQ